VNAKTSALRNELLALPTEDRAVLAAELLASLDDEVSDADPAEIDRAWGDEMVRRSEQIATGEVTTLSWSEVLEQIAARRSSR
jgi:putative addiction module component (TIGR02574 family)